MLFTGMATEAADKKKAKQLRHFVCFQYKTEVAKAEGVRCVDLFQPTQRAGSTKSITMNGVHLNSDGNELMAKIISLGIFSLPVR